MNKIKNQKIEKFLKELSSNSATPGGGAVAAISGAMAASLIEMVAALTLGKSSYAKVQSKAKEIKNKAFVAKSVFLKYADEDVAAFNSVMAAYKSRDKVKIAKSLKKAAEVPGRISKLASQTILMARTMAKIGNKNAFSDAKSAIYLAQAAKKAADENVKINLKLLKRLEA